MLTQLVLVLAALTVASPKIPRSPDAPVSSVTCNGAEYTYERLAGYGFVPSDALDKFDDTVGGHGSAIAVEHGSWTLKDGVYSGIIHTQPDRGWNTEGTLNYQSRVHKWNITLTPQPDATVANPSGPNIEMQYLDSIAYTGPSGFPTTGIDGAFRGHLSHKGFPDLPHAVYVGNGFNGTGPGGNAVPIDAEGLVLAPDGSFWVGDEYGPYLYHFNSAGKMVEAIRPPDAYIPMRNGTESWSADSPPLYDPTLVPIPADNPTGRDNNHGFEGLTASPDGMTLYALLQAALNQDGGESSSTDRYTRMVIYDISASPATLLHEYVVELPQYNSSGKFKTAAQSEIHYISPTQFLVLARDSSAGHGQDSSESLYRHADVFDISTATDIKGAKYDSTTGSIADPDTGVLVGGIELATYCPFLDFNVNAQLNRFGVHNGGAQDSNLLNEKWESFALVPVFPGTEGNGEEFFLLSFSDNDFITQNGYLNHGTYPYEDASGFNLDNQMLAFHVKLPVGSAPLVS